jgi:hypothetical protein
MSAVDEYLQQLEAALRVRGRARRRLLAECRDHLADAGAVQGHEEAVRRFGTAADMARSLDTEVVVRRGLRATLASVVGVLAVGASAWAIVNGADPHASAVVAWAVVFFACAQTAAVSAFLAALRAAAIRREPATPAGVALLCRRNATALAFALATLFAAGAAVPGHTSAWKVLSGPAIAAVAATSVLRSRSLARKLDTRTSRIVQAPLTDLLTVARRSSSASGPAASSRSIALLGPTVAVATVAAFLWDHLDHGTLASSVAAAGIEAALTVAGFLLLGPALGLRAARRTSRGSATA